jgi:dihydrodipicolinate synthase/N-acetylneuraminate lyase
VVIFLTKNRRLTLDAYEQKFADFIQMCADAKRNDIGVIVVSHPRVLGDNYGEVIESLSRLAEAGLALQIASR